MKRIILLSKSNKLLLMKNTFILLISTYFLQSCSVFQTNKISINGFVENNSLYLGGTPPLEGMEERLAIYRVASNQEFFVRKDSVINQNDAILTQFKTDEKGNYNILLSKGIYSVFRKEKIDYVKYASKTEPCEWLLQPDFILIINENKKYISQFTIDRNPCGMQIQ